MKATTKEQYKTAWKSHIRELNIVALDLPAEQLTEYLNALDKVKSFVDMAADGLNLPEK